MSYRNNSRLKRSVVWKMPKEEFAALVKNSETIGEILREFSLANKGGNSKTVKKRIAHDCLDISHITLGLGSNKNKKRGGVRPVSIEAILVKHSTYNRGHLKERLIKNGFLKEVCEICSIVDKWNDKKLVLRLDHKNGVSDDCRLENLRLICPNCDSQLLTYCGRNVKSKS